MKTTRTTAKDSRKPRKAPASRKIDPDPIPDRSERSDEEAIGRIVQLDDARPSHLGETENTPDQERRGGERRDADGGQTEPASR